MVDFCMPKGVNTEIEPALLSNAFNEYSLRVLERFNTCNSFSFLIFWDIFPHNIYYKTYKLKI